jgi:hypothetical protein
VALILIAPGGLEQAGLLRRLHALREDSQAEAVTESDSRAGQGVGAIARSQIVHQRLVELELVRREAAQVTEGGVPGAEVIDGDANPGPLEFGQGDEARRRNPALSARGAGAGSERRPATATSRSSPAVKPRLSVTGAKRSTLASSTAPQPAGSSSSTASRTACSNRRRLGSPVNAS